MKLQKIFVISILCGIILACFQGCEKKKVEYHYNFDNVVSYYEQNEAKILDCIDELTNLLGDYPRGVFQVRKADNERVQVKHLADDGGVTTKYIHSAPIAAILEDDLFDLIIVRSCCVEFHLDFFARERALIFISSGKIEDAFGYDKGMIFTETANGFVGFFEDSQNGDNMFFYSKIAEKFFYCETQY